VPRAPAGQLGRGARARRRRRGRSRASPPRTARSPSETTSLASRSAWGARRAPTARHRSPPRASPANRDTRSTMAPSESVGDQPPPGRRRPLRERAYQGWDLNPRPAGYESAALTSELPWRQPYSDLGPRRCAHRTAWAMGRVAPPPPAGGAGSRPPAAAPERAGARRFGGGDEGRGGSACSPERWTQAWCCAHSAPPHSGQPHGGGSPPLPGAGSYPARPSGATRGDIATIRLGTPSGPSTGRGRHRPPAAASPARRRPPRRARVPCAPLPWVGRRPPHSHPRPEGGRPCGHVRSEAMP
jgi:hypothetical protein